MTFGSVLIAIAGILSAVFAGLFHLRGRWQAAARAQEHDRLEAEVRTQEAARAARESKAQAVETAGVQSAERTYQSAERAEPTDADARELLERHRRRFE